MFWKMHTATHHRLCEKRALINAEACVSPHKWQSEPTIAQGPAGSKIKEKLINVDGAKSGKCFKVA
jgi:hypothetical protein